jgi:hypothetical protein
VPANFSPQRIKRFIGMDGYSDPTSLGEGVAQLIQNMRPQKRAIYTREGLTKHNATIIPTSAGIYGLGRYYANTTTPLTIAISNGSMYTGDVNGVFTSRYSGLASTSHCKVVQFSDKALIIDRITGILVYKYGVTPYFAGVPTPILTRLLDSFEDATLWTVTSGTATNDYVHYTNGLQAVNFTSTSGGTMVATKTYSGVDFTTFSDGTTTLATDYVALDIIPGMPANITSLTLDIGTGAVGSEFASYFTVTLSFEDVWVNNSLPFVQLTLRVRQRKFQTGAGSPSWATVRGVRLTAVAASGQTATIICDNLRLERSGPIATEYRKKIADFESNEAWTQTAGAGSFVLNYQYKYFGDASLQITGNVTVDYTVSLNLTTFDDGTASSTIDDIQIYLGRTATATGAATIALRFYYDATHYYSTSFTVSNITRKANSFQGFTVSKALFTPGGGTPSWSTISKVEIVTAGLSAGSVYLDYCSLIPHVEMTQVAAFESSEDWEFLDATTGTKSWSSLISRADEGSGNSLQISTKPGKPSATIVLTGLSLNLTSYPSGVAVQTSDLNGIWCYIPNIATVKQIQLQAGTTGLADYFEKVIIKDDFPSLQSPEKDNWYQLRFAESDFVTVTGSPTWSNIQELRVVITPNSKALGTKVYLDQWCIVRSAQLTGTYYYFVTYETVDGDESESSNISDPLTVKSSQISLTVIPTTTVARVARINIYRIGGMSDEYQFVMGIENSSQATAVDSIIEDNLGAIYEDLSGAPYIPKAICVHDKKVVIANLTASDGTYYPAGVMVSNENSYETFDPLNFFEIEPNAGFEIKWLISFNNFVWVGKEDSIWRFDPNNLDIPPYCVTRDFGGVGLLSVIKGKNEFYALSKTDAIICNGDTVTSFSEPWVRNFINSIPSTYLDKSWMEFFDNTILIGIPQGSDTSPTLILAFHTLTNSWFTISGWTVRCAMVPPKGSEGNILLLGSATLGQVYRGFYGDDDDGVAIQSVIFTSHQDFGSPELMKDYSKIFIFGNTLTSSPVQLVINPWLDGGDTGINLTDPILTTITSSANSKLELPMPSLGGFGSFLGLKITATKRWTFRGLTQHIRQLGAT